MQQMKCLDAFVDGMPDPDDPGSLLTRVRRRLFANVLSTMDQQPGPDYERDLANIENPIIVPSRRSVLDAVERFLACEEAFCNHVMSLDPNGRDPDRQYPEDAEYDALDKARREWEGSARTLLVALMAGGRPPRRWAVRRWARRVLWMRWYLREGAGQRRRGPWAPGDPWASRPDTIDKPPF